jgi:hypothetical protein
VQLLAGFAQPAMRDSYQSVCRGQTASGPVWHRLRQHVSKPVDQGREAFCLES